MADKSKSESKQSESAPDLRQISESRSLASALLGIDEGARNIIFSRAVALARDLITKPGGMDSSDRVNLNYLLASGVKVNSRLGSGDTLLIVACKAGDSETVFALRNRGADKNLTDLSGNDARYWADLRGLQKIVDILDNQWQIPEKLLSGPKVNEFAIKAEEAMAQKLVVQRSKIVQLLRRHNGI